ncbi:inactive serine/threonine-protein kinase VRK3 isoform X2 [Rhinatrema bivittatum]|uniref:inactive serine/threonine-protein kinase VRK3 isoform X2 n=1 Tax=Rhinatrema bivittatum TaxID=194408 RepID=UPI00112B10F7|nr:inactive serine/threonine-protein kinase VRK3 isoform X2 [Rhinatrema bivittatum]
MSAGEEGQDGEQRLLETQRWNRLCSQWLRLQRALARVLEQCGIHSIYRFTMIVHFCPQCGQKAESLFKFCPYCGIKLPKEEQEMIIETAAIQGPSTSPIVDPNQESTVKKSPTKRKSSSVTPQKEVYYTAPKCEVFGLESSPAIETTSKAKSSPRAKRAKNTFVDPLPEKTILTDNSFKQWKLGRFLPLAGQGLLYEVRSATGTSLEKQKYYLKLDAKDGKIYTEQNFLQRAAKKSNVDKWKKSHDVPFLGIPNCIGFGLHEDIYRFLVFPDMGRSLQSIMDEDLRIITDIAVLQISYRMLDILEYIHENEYVHGDINAENIFLNPADLQEVYLVGYYFAFRYCPGGKHVAYREGNRKPHEGSAEFISIDIHKGVGPSRRSDLQTLGYCMLKWLGGSLPWTPEVMNVCAVMNQKESYKGDIAGLLRKCCSKKKIPGAVKKYLEQVMFLSYDEKPDYEALKKILAEALQNMNSFAYNPVNLRV